MKRIKILSMVAFVLLLTTFVVVRAEARGRDSRCHSRWNHARRVSFLAHELKLSDAQKSQILELWRAERPIIAAQIRDLLAENKEMNAVSGKDSPDPSEVQKIADREASTIATILVEKARLQSKINSTVLNPDQRTKADELQKKWESRLDRFADRFATQST
jgi:Spy/CpxP family protein refolding chaperone